jgi:hypothetical protein
MLPAQHSVDRLTLPCAQRRERDEDDKTIQFNFTVPAADDGHHVRVVFSPRKRVQETALSLDDLPTPTVTPLTPSTPRTPAVLSPLISRPVAHARALQTPIDRAVVTSASPRLRPNQATNLSRSIPALNLGAAPVPTHATASTDDDPFTSDNSVYIPAHRRALGPGAVKYAVPHATRASFPPFFAPLPSNTKSWYVVGRGYDIGVFYDQWYVFALQFHQTTGQSVTTFQGFYRSPGQASQGKGCRVSQGQRRDGGVGSI